ncbi:TPA: hypothetical protein IAA82_05585 [Candidatus Galligastranaerophilus gallistercoris]|nr:hypothetical protein [Candidatus Galligastranaerophilus gallistercoris]
MSINPVQGFKEATPAKKAATVAGAVAGLAAVGSLAYAIKTGKVADTFEGNAAQKVVAKAKNGYMELGAKIAKKAGEAKDWAADKIETLKAKFKKEEVEQTVEEVVEDVQ